jgi:glycine cleavage system transcriptional repressor
MGRYALTAVGRDRPGIVAAVTKALYEHGCNIEDSSMTILQDEFAVILIMSTPDTIDTDSLKKALEGVEGSMGLTIHLKEIEKEEAPKGPESNHLVTVSGYDRPGIVYKTTETLAKWGANITDLETKVVHGEDKNIYILLMEVFLPEDIDEKVVEDKLKSLGESLGVTITVKPIESYEAL